jgi:WXXGXW repeat (2 copies)
MGHSIKLYYLLFSAFIILAGVSASRAEVSVGVSINIAPPALPVYEQPVCPGDGYLWTPGYWAYGDDGYYWVPGMWVLAPQPGLLWTPGYWGWSDGFYVWHGGYWGRHVGYYGGICYGFGYTGVGFYGGRWRDGVFRYNRAVANVNVTVVRNTYSKTVLNNTTVSRVSYNGGKGGAMAKPTALQLAAVHEKHIPPTVQQTQHHQSALANRELSASVNHGQPTQGALAKHEAAFSTTNREKGRPAEFHSTQREHSRPDHARPHEHDR